MTIVEVVYGRQDPTAAGSCPRCKGDGSETVGEVGPYPCPYCAGAGVNPHLQGYAYRLAEPAEVGDLVRVPPSPYGRQDDVATVVRLGSDYAGPILWATKVEGPT